ncbi:hypothetical protein LSH36_569g00000 [Paralvinella palmiformis]|uniref:Reverse transcriptase domain-containing protein n=1 Tax=Paralvinella palmiformis TaxID=53620 RepID=A0AAD9J607_9ANNE|nr:hypothetical protein LSH36_569g00000 [Paralvinella palmiformis]
MTCCIKNLKRNRSSGLDGVWSENYFINGTSNLCSCLASLYTHILKYNCVPTRVLIPFPKKATLDPNRPEHHRPITLSSVYSTLFEYIIIPDVILNNNQFGFRKGCGTSVGNGLLMDILCHHKRAKIPMFFCSLDAEKCFHSI